MINISTCQKLNSLDVAMTYIVYLLVKVYAE